MRCKRLDIDLNKIYQSNNYGDFIILEETTNNNDTHRSFKIKFLQTGYICDANLSAIIKGQVRDPYFPIKYGIGYTGNIDKPSDNILYTTWNGMICRCYDTSRQDYNNYGGIGITVDPRWHCFEYFIYDCQFLLNYDKFIQEPNNYQLDKDYLQQNIPKEQRVYSKDTCVFLNKYDNSNLMAIETKHKHNNKYFGVHEEQNKYRLQIMSDNKHIHLGMFDDEIAAANVYNVYSNIYNKAELVKLQNDVPYMSPSEIMQHTSSKFMLDNKLPMIINVNK